jgi:multidrug efflux pump subunit AcrA (membrane-fusion protein)
LLAARQKKLRDLASQNILSSNQLDETEAKALEVQMRRLKAEKAIRDGIKQVAEVKKQIQQANYYAPIDGIVSSLVVDPQQVMGSFMVGPFQ